MIASTSVPDTRLAHKKPDQKLSEEKQVLKRESVNLLQREKELELKVQELKCKLQVWGNVKWTLLTASVSDNTSVLCLIILQFSCGLLFGTQKDYAG